MSIENQACSLELAKRLKEIGVKQESLFYRYNYPYNDGENDWCTTVYCEIPDHITEIYSAFTISELGEMLPNYVLSNDLEPFNGFRIVIEKFIAVENEEYTNNWVINYHCDTTEVHGKNAFFAKRLTKNIYDPNLANAMAKMLIYLIENKLIGNDK